MVETEVVLPDGRRSGAKWMMPLRLTPSPRMLRMTPIRRRIRRDGGKVRRWGRIRQRRLAGIVTCDGTWMALAAR